VADKPQAGRTVPRHLARFDDGISFARFNGFREFRVRAGRCEFHSSGREQNAGPGN